MPRLQHLSGAAWSLALFRRSVLAIDPHRRRHLVTLPTILSTRRPAVKSRRSVVHDNVRRFHGLPLVTLLRALWYLDDMSPRRRTEPRAPTLGDVARQAGVSPSTAARALGRYGSVSPEARARTEAAASRLGYRRNRLASSMITGRTHTLAFVAADIGNVFFAQALRGAADVAHEAGLEVIIANSDEDLALERAAVRVLDERRVDGFIIAPVGDGASEHIAGLLARGTPVVFFDRIAPGIEADAVLIDNVQAARSGVQWLSRMGHQRIGLITTGLGTGDPVEQLERIAFDPRPASTTDARGAGYLAALRAAHLPVDPGLIVDAPYSRERQPRRSLICCAATHDRRPCSRSTTS